MIDRLPAPLVLLIFLVPFLIVEPLLVVATVAIAMGYVVSGAIAWIVLKILAVGLLPAIFDLTQHKLMTMPWFVRAYGKVAAFHHYADQIVAPYKEAAAALLRQWRRRAGAATRRVPGVAQLAARFAARKRAANGGPRSHRTARSRVAVGVRQRCRPARDPRFRRRMQRVGKRRACGRR